MTPSESKQSYSAMPAGPKAVLHEKYGPVERWFTKDGEIIATPKAPHVVHIAYRGNIGDTFLRPIIEMADGLIARMAPLTLFADIRDITDTSPRMRMVVTKWTWANRRHYRSYNVLIKPGPVGTTMAAISLRLGGFINVWTKPAEFESALEQASGLDTHGS
jgi:hypothetical protein